MDKYFDILRKGMNVIFLIFVDTQKFHKMTFKLYNDQKIKSELEHHLCPVHSKPPVIESTSEGFRYSTCCKEFGDALQRLLTEILDKEIKESVTCHLDKIHKSE